MFRRAETVRLLVERHAPEHAGDIDFATLEPVGGERLGEALARRYADAVWTARSPDGATIYVFLTEFQRDNERRRTGASDALDDILYSGFYPRIHDRGLDPTQALGDYLETYVERDVRRIDEVRDLSAFRRFVRLCAGRVGQLADLGSLGSDASIPQATARHWLTVLEASYVVFQLPPFFGNIRKRVVKSPKLYFHDVGLASHLLGIENAGQVATHPLRGPLFENAVVVEALKHRFNTGRRSNLSFFRDADGLECDLLYENGNGIGVIETKSGTKIRPGHLSALDRGREAAPARMRPGSDPRRNGPAGAGELRGDPA